MTRDELIVSWFEESWWPIYDAVTTNGISSVSQKDRVLFLVGYLIDQLCNGGTNAVYANSSGAFAAEIPVALDRIGAIQAAQVMRGINALFPGGKPAVDDDLRAEQFDSLPPLAVRKGEELEQIFDEWLPGDDGRVMLNQLYDFYHE